MQPWRMDAHAPTPREGHQRMHTLHPVACHLLPALVPVCIHPCKRSILSPASLCLPPACLPPACLPNTSIDRMPPMRAHPDATRQGRGMHVPAGLDSINTCTPCMQALQMHVTVSSDSFRVPMLYVHAFVALCVRACVRTAGSGSVVFYSGCSVVQDADVVSVSLNYRLGLLGFLALPELRDKTGVYKDTAGTVGNWGILVSHRSGGAETLQGQGQGQGQLAH